MTITIKKSDEQGCRAVNVAGRSLRLYLLKRGDRLPDVKVSVYILFDERRTCFYIGETDNKPAGGFNERFKDHERKERWFSKAICLTDARFTDSYVRKWIEWRLYSLAKSCRYALTSSATGTYSTLDAPSGAQELFDEIVELLELFGIPWANEGIETTPNPPSPPAQSYRSMTQLAKAIATKYNGGRSADYAIQLLGKKVAVKAGKWHDYLERAGLSFDAAGFVMDWRIARNPLP